MFNRKLAKFIKIYEEATIPIGLGWKIEPSNMVLDEGSPIALTESSMEVMSSIKFIIFHRILNRLQQKQ
jgi:hypothetical protein